jgi:hypothetical protein
MQNPEVAGAVLFVGPSLAGYESEGLFPPHVRVCGPIRRGDMDALPPSVTDVLIVDGVFHSTRYVSRKLSPDSCAPRRFILC